jgi:hypothetical protein
MVPSLESDVYQGVNDANKITQTHKVAFFNLSIDIGDTKSSMAPFCRSRPGPVIDVIHSRE